MEMSSQTNAEMGKPKQILQTNIVMNTYCNQATDKHNMGESRTPTSVLWTWETHGGNASVHGVHSKCSKDCNNYKDDD